MPCGYFGGGGGGGGMCPFASPPLGSGTEDMTNIISNIFDRNQSNQKGSDHRSFVP